MGGGEPRVTKDVVLRSLEPLVEISDEASVASLPELRCKHLLD